MNNKIEVKINNLKDKTILIVDNDYTNYLLVAEILEETEIQIIWAKSGIDAINFCKDNIWFDLILIDYRIPMLNGLDAIIKLLQLNPKYKIIGLSAINSETEFKMAGAIDFILKPIGNLTDFFHKIVNYVNMENKYNNL